MRAGTVGAALAAAVAVLAVAGCGGAGDMDLNEYAAADMCHKFVSDRLKAPATADFGDDDTSGSGTGPWTVAGHVDSENGFGAKIRSTYTCTLTADAAADSSGERTWHLTNLDFVDGG